MKYRHYAPRAPLYLVEAGEKQGEQLVALLADLAPGESVPDC